MESIEQLTHRYPSETFRKGQTLLLKDEIPKAVYIIQKGLVRAYTITADGAERSIWIYEKTNDIPLGFSLGLVDRAEYFYEAYTNCTVRLVPREVFSKLEGNDIEMLQLRYKEQTAKLIKALEQINALEHPKAGDKVAFMMLHMADRIGTRIRPYKYRRKLSITQQEIADSLGLTRETTGAELKKLEVKQLLHHSRKNYVLYMEKLRNYLKNR